MLAMFGQQLLEMGDRRITGPLRRVHQHRLPGSLPGPGVC